MSEDDNYSQYQLEYVRPWNVPLDIWWDKTEGAHVRRGQWVIDNCPEVSMGELRRIFAMQLKDIDQLGLSSRGFAEEPADE